MIERVKRSVPDFANQMAASRWGQALIQNIVRHEQSPVLAIYVRVNDFSNAADKSLLNQFRDRSLVELDPENQQYSFLKEVAHRAPVDPTDLLSLLVGVPSKNRA